MMRAAAMILVMAAACSSGKDESATTKTSTVATTSTMPSPSTSSTTTMTTPTPTLTPDAAVDAAVAKPPIVDAPMKWSAEREALTLEYRRRHSDAAATDVTIAPHIIVLHYTDGSSAKSTRGYFDNVRIEAERKQLAAAGAVNVSAHYVVDRDGTIYQLQPPTRFARHCIGLNHVAIGIENAGNDTTYPLTDAQIEADAVLVRYLASQYPITKLLGHYEVMGMRGKSPDYVELDPKYHNDKPDPGEAFMTAVRARVEDLHLGGPE